MEENNGSAKEFFIHVCGLFFLSASVPLDFCPKLVCQPCYGFWHLHSFSPRKHKKIVFSYSRSTTFLVFKKNFTKVSKMFQLVLWSRSRSEPVLFGQSRSRCKGPAPDKTEEILNDTGILSARFNID